MTRLLAMTTPLLVAALLTACATPSNMLNPIGEGRVAAMTPGQTVILTKKGSLQYVRLVNDSRCATDVQCVWAGDAVLAMHWTSQSGQSQDVELHTNRTRGLDHADLDGRRVTLTDLSRQGAEASFEVTRLP